MKERVTHVYRLGGDGATSSLLNQLGVPIIDIIFQVFDFGYLIQLNLVHYMKE